MAIRNSGFEGAEKILVLAFQKLGAYWAFQGTSALEHVDPHDVNDREIIDSNQPELVCRLLERPDMDDYVPDSNGQTPLLWAIQYKRVDIVKLLLQRQEVNPDTPDRNGFTPSQLAVGVRSLPPVELLLQLEEVNARGTDAGNSSALHIAAARTLLYTGLFEVAIKYHPSLVPIYDDDDEKNDDDDDEDDYSYTLDEPPGYREESFSSIKRLLARQEGNAGGHDQDCEVVALLLQRQDVDPKARAINGQTPPHLAASHHQLSAKRVMSRSRWPDCPALPLWRVRQEFPVPELIETLLEAGVPLDQESVTGLTVSIKHSAADIGVSLCLFSTVVQIP
ncbi:hypothetical protein FMEXI_11345 [Fusarium mexicanum]|uniref:Ankyrin n=1 Tax=Fusarium mexicanum TaxID=751941 RepID=A0A8H5IEB8_9HYPO|nr:hypothetical protein FMEXI_11345 [Fusarium mexicanum]